MYIIKEVFIAKYKEQQFFMKILVISDELCLNDSYVLWDRCI